ncbi:putative tubulin delta chain [Neospora caninum Liverpool]|uniref:Tubulin delta chain n=1 Tax=Neospora caninum (strain Liverpool) TaxID=572307 RepID=F0V7S8_NEOCL|nr:putative tubulin delta chain [Neospora caninum Liverpool]CBZ49769.1 putative tubulin delta chain [Neospora caninum Liverpool]CEL64357.1 TPA: tubulin delta chain, putative [Neospora caninum Liverpool]|eukprot:XP_003879804.1 putative tubulin delta chain [Neospora caninum Liverpool]
MTVASRSFWSVDASPSRPTMAVVAVQLGQCGNQLGGALFSRLAEEISIAQSVRDEARARKLADIYFRDSEARQVVASAPGSFFDSSGISPFTSLHRKREDPAAVAHDAWSPQDSGRLSPQWSSAPAIARCILIDSEPGVLDVCLSGAPYSTHTRDRKAHSSLFSSNRTFAASRNLHKSAFGTHFRWQYSKRNAVYGARAAGCGNNWAVGYLREGPRREEAIAEALQRELEKAESLSSVLLIHSLAGGTGSGLGAFMNALCHDLLGSTSTVNLAVWPFTSGELSVQSYNTALSLAHAYSFMDGMVLTENARLEELCRGPGTTCGGPSFDDLNRAISAAVASATLLPHHSWVTQEAPGCLQRRLRLQPSHRRGQSMRCRGAEATSSGRQTPSCNLSVSPGTPSSFATHESAPLPLGASPLSFVVRDLCSQPAYKLLTVFHNPMPVSTPASNAHSFESLRGFLSSSCQHDSPFGGDSYAALFKQVLRQFSRSTPTIPASSGASDGRIRNGAAVGSERLPNRGSAVSPPTKQGKLYRSSTDWTGKLALPHTPYSEGGRNKTPRGPRSNPSGDARTYGRDEGVTSGIPKTDTVPRTGERRSGSNRTVGIWAIVRGRDIETAETEERFWPEEQLDAAVRVWKEDTVPIRVRMARTTVRWIRVTLSRK